MIAVLWFFLDYQFIHLFFSELGPGAIRTITIRDDTAFAETIEVKRFWQFPKFDGSSYYDIAVIELGK